MEEHAPSYVVADAQSIMEEPSFVEVAFNRLINRAAIGLGEAPTKVYLSGWGEFEKVKEVVYQFGHVVAQMRNPNPTYGDPSFTELIVRDTFCCSFDYSFTKEHKEHKLIYIKIMACSSNAEQITLLEKAILPLLGKKKQEHTVSMLCSQGGTLHLTTVGKITNQLNTDNYSSKVIDSYRHVLSCLNTKDPCGRLSLISGPPGTGKSYIIRAMIAQNDSSFVVVPANLVGALSGPEILPVLLQNKEENDNENSTVLIIEDADACLVSRKKGSDSGKVSDLLNMGDGLIGQLADIRIVATTNAERVELDEAITRPGRMCKHIHIGLLNPEEANKAYLKLIGENEKGRDFNKGTSLAEVYRVARDVGWKPDPDPGKKESGQYL
jgi:hypothetical protein